MSIKRAARLDIRIAIQRKTTHDSNSGEQIETWTDLARRWAEVKPMTGDERLVGENLVAKEQVKFIIRWDSSIADLNPKDRIVMPPSSNPTDLDIYNIVQASMVDRNEDFVILAYRYASAS